MGWGDCRAVDSVDRACYFGLPFYRAMFEAAGYGNDVAAYDAAEDRAARRNTVSDGSSSICAPSATTRQSGRCWTGTEPLGRTTR